MWDRWESIEWDCAQPICSNGKGWDSLGSGAERDFDHPITDPRSFTFTGLIRQYVAPPGPPTGTYPQGWVDASDFRDWNTRAEFTLTFAPAAEGSTYSITVSDSSAAPEPATWILTIAGAFGVGSLLRRRSKQAQPLAA